MDIDVSGRRSDDSFIGPETCGYCGGVAGCPADKVMHVRLRLPNPFPNQFGTFVTEAVQAVSVGVLKVCLHQRLHDFRVSAKAVVTYEVNHGITRSSPSSSSAILLCPLFCRLVCFVSGERRTHLFPVEDAD